VLEFFLTTGLRCTNIHGNDSYFNGYSGDHVLIHGAFWINICYTPLTVVCSPQVVKEVNFLGLNYVNAFSQFCLQDFSYDAWIKGRVDFEAMGCR